LHPFFKQEIGLKVHACLTKMTLEVVHGSRRLPLTGTFRGLINPVIQATENAEDGKQALRGGG
jgi:hypothetical protein